jgi:uncharacterized protein YehS (DUF1456 family)
MEQIEKPLILDSNDDGENDKLLMYNSWYKQLRVALEFSVDDIKQILSFTEGQLKTSSCIRGWALSEDSPAFYKMKKVDWCRIMAGLPMYFNRVRFESGASALEEERAAASAAARKESTRKRLETMAKKKADAVK